MKSKQEIIEFCNIISKCHTYPIHYYFQDNLCWERPLPPAGLFIPDPSSIIENTASVGLYNTPEGLIYGSVVSEDKAHFVIVGPISLTPVTFDSIHKIIKTYGLNAELKESLRSYLGRSSGYSLPHLKNILSLINFYINGENEQASQNLMQQNDLLNKEIHIQHLEENMEEYSYSSFLAAYHYEKEVLENIRNGNIHGILNGGSTSIDMHIGILSHSELRQVKDLFICTTTLASRAAMEGGLDLKTAYQLSDLYLQKIENSSSVSSLKELTNTMLLDFTERTCKAKQTKDVPFDIWECIQYIRQNTHTPLRVEMLAANMHISKSQLDRRFKTTLGFSPSEFILRCKLEEAKDLLLNTNHSISAISQLLCFSSQSHFSNTFKKNYGISPLEFRKHKK